MKKLFILTAMAALLAIGYESQAQPQLTNAPLSFANQLLSWGTSIRYTNELGQPIGWPTNEISISIGAKWLNNVDWANYIGARETYHSLAFDEQMANQGIAGTIERVQAGAGWRFMGENGDLALYAFLDNGYDRPVKSGFTELKGTGAKLVGSGGAFTEMSLYYDLYWKSSVPTQDYPGIDVGAGDTFKTVVKGNAPVLGIGRVEFHLFFGGHQNYAQR